jgi:phage baseplate assembly protein V
MQSRFHNFASDALRLATIAEINLVNAAVRVDLGDMESDWLPIGTARAGETRIWSPPSVGEQVAVFAPDGDLEGAFVLGGLFSDAYPAPGQTARELIAFKDGSVLAYDPETHHLEVILCGGGQITLTAPALVTINAPGGMTINGDVMLNGKLTASNDVIASGKSLKGHKHTGVQAGGAQSGPPA